MANNYGGALRDSAARDVAKWRGERFPGTPRAPSGTQSVTHWVHHTQSDCVINKRKILKDTSSE